MENRPIRHLTLIEGRPAATRWYARTGSYSNPSLPRSAPQVLTIAHCNGAIFLYCARRASRFLRILHVVVRRREAGSRVAFVNSRRSMPRETSANVSANVTGAQIGVSLFSITSVCP
jgi:hypothetical protein